MMSQTIGQSGNNSLPADSKQACSKLENGRSSVAASARPAATFSLPTLRHQHYFPAALAGQLQNLHPDLAQRLYSERLLHSHLECA